MTTPGLHYNWTHPLWASGEPATWADAFGDPTMTDRAVADAALTWRERTPHHEYAAHLHQHGIPPMRADSIAEQLLNAIRDVLKAEQGGPAVVRAAGRAAALRLIHPHLPADDVRALALTDIPLTEADHLIAAGPIDRDTLHVMAGLT